MFLNFLGIGGGRGEKGKNPLKSKKEFEGGGKGGSTIDNFSLIACCEGGGKKKEKSLPG